MANTDIETRTGSAPLQEQLSDPVPAPSEQPDDEFCLTGGEGKAESCSAQNVSEDPSPENGVNVLVNSVGTDVEPEPAGTKSICNEIKAQERGSSEEADVQDQAKSADEEEGLSEEEDLEDAPGPDDVLCDSCIDSPRRACKSCLTCLVSYCKAHLRPHLENTRFQSHRLVEPLQDMEVRTCDSHCWPLELYCRQDGCCVCQECANGTHRGHDVVPVGEARSLIERELELKQTKTLRNVTAVDNAIQKLHSNTISIETSVGEARSIIRQQFIRLQDVVEKAQKEMTEILEAEARQAVKHTESICTHLKQKRADLRRSQAQMDKLSRHTNDIDFLEEYSQLKLDSVDFSLPVVYISQADNITTFSRTVVEATTELSERLPSVYREKLKGTDKTDKIRIKTMVRDLSDANPKTRNDFLKYSTALSFDPQTVHKFLRLTTENRKVTNTTPWQHDYPDVPERFEHWKQVLTVESFYLGHGYFEVEVKGEGAYVGLTYKTIDRKGEGSSGCIAGNDFSWCLQCGARGFSAWHGDAETPLKTERFSRVGVYVDYTQSWLAFYGVANTMTLLHGYHAEFLEPLFPAVWLPKKDNAVVLVGPGDIPPESSSLPSSTPLNAPTVPSDTNDAN